MPRGPANMCHAGTLFGRDCCGAALHKSANANEICQVVNNRKEVIQCLIVIRR